MDSRKKYQRTVINYVAIGGTLFLLGVITGEFLRRLIKTSNGIIAIALVDVIVIGLITYFYYSYLMKHQTVAIESGQRVRHYWYWMMVVLLFFVYYMSNIERFKKTYSPNGLGIDQEQYIFLINGAIFVLAGLVVYYFMIRRFEIKSISITTAGIELSLPEVIAETQKESLNINTSLIRTISDHICKIDELIYYLSTINYISETIPLGQYIDILKSVLIPITEHYEEMSITVLTESEFEHYLVEELALKRRIVEKLQNILKNDEIYRYENELFLSYELAEFHNYSESVNIYIVIHIEELFADEVGQLIYTYINVFEALYSKYCLIKLIKEE